MYIKTHAGEGGIEPPPFVRDINLKLLCKPTENMKSRELNYTGRMFCLTELLTQGLCILILTKEDAQRYLKKHV